MFSNILNRTFDDRFIPKRKYNDIDSSHYKLISSSDDTKIKNDIFSMKPKALNKYRELLQESFNYHDERPILSFSAKPKIFKKKEKKLKKLWPCIPRSYPIIKKPEIILDWPGSISGLYWNVVDWGSNGYVAAIWSGRVYLWHTEPSTKSHTEEEVTSTSMKGFGALRWSHNSAYLAVSETFSNFSFTIYSFPSLKRVQSLTLPEWRTGSISAFCWDHTDTVLIIGCSKGLILSFDIKKEFREYAKAHPESKVLKLEINSNNTFVCSSGFDGIVRIWTWPKLHPHLNIIYSNPVCAIAFHPWRTNLLCIGGGNGSLNLWDITSCERIAYHAPVKSSTVDCLAWNKVSGELVSSHYILGPKNNDDEEGPSKFSTRVLVLSGLDNVVDYVPHHKGRVVYLMWDKTGSKLATASSDESLCIWNFLGPESNRNKLEEKKYSVLSRLEKCIR